MGAHRIQLRAVERKQPKHSNVIQAELRLRAARNALWSVIYAAQEADLKEVVDVAGRLHLNVVRELQHLQEVA